MQNELRAALFRAFVPEYCNDKLLAFTGIFAVIGLVFDDNFKTRVVVVSVRDVERLLHR